MMTCHKTPAILVVLFALIGSSAVGAAERQKVFNGKNLDGWTVSRCEAAVEDGVLLLKRRERTRLSQRPVPRFCFRVQVEGTEPRDVGFGSLFPL